MGVMLKVDGGNSLCMYLDFVPLTVADKLRIATIFLTRRSSPMTLVILLGTDDEFNAI